MTPDTLAAALVAGAATLIGKIVWDWLAEKKKPAQHCEDHECLAKEIQQLRIDWMTQNAAHNETLALIKLDLSYIKKKLDMNGTVK
jgi:hypothetical protein